ncbi:hypothetical protein P152DRAFT_184625 [Eremomyces bilateralis CBS 781.70]|uniref:Uncharacterized protein n=1 Tax=Eremomyces bilateralis CBS 781.70 TaxID=1392243 RepID=A0A6G1GBS3_9PEZI|nr:uncharacterized protein P152DRAFT_184625 [Eremomyces bilateralis CBS 781.70]KAF1815396.1 hypothetical protein P152DRAFT_184625 [Eremomyces bilateralis CBS 781.70]
MAYLQDTRSLEPEYSTAIYPSDAAQTPYWSYQDIFPLGAKHPPPGDPSSVQTNEAGLASHSIPRLLKKMPKSSALSIALSNPNNYKGERSQSVPQSPSSPRPEGRAADGTSPTEKYTALPHIASLAQSTKPTKRNKEHTKSIFSNYKASKSSTRLAASESSSANSGSPAISSIYPYRKGTGSTPELSLIDTSGVEVGGELKCNTFAANNSILLTRAYYSHAPAIHNSQLSTTEPN